MSDEQENFFDAVLSDRTMKASQKIEWLHATCKDYWQRIADLERAYARAVRMCVYWKQQRDLLRAAAIYVADDIRDVDQPDPVSAYAARLRQLDEAIRATREFGDGDYVPQLHAEEVTARQPGGSG